ncbi:general substrate transporter [Astrocystis sublimbata]|nr:general substrate transporter [Astrocystis sublimbata]
MFGQSKHQAEQAENVNNGAVAREKPGSNEKITAIACFMGLVASIGGFMFGYVSGQISGYFNMADYARRFGDADGSFSAAKQGSIVGLLSVGCLIGALIAGKLADSLGRRMAISAFALWAIVGNIIEVSSEYAWYQFAIGRLVTGVSIGALSVVVPMYQSESSPTIIRGVLISTYQLFITLGIWTSYLVDWGTHHMDSSASWRIPNGLGFLWSLILGLGILFLPESPRYAYAQGRTEESRRTIARLAGVDENDPVVNSQINEIQNKVKEESVQGKARLVEVFTGPRMLYRTLLGIVLQAGQQLTGANFFFYYGTTIFEATGLGDSYVTQIILGSVNVLFTFVGLYVVAKVGRRKALMTGAGWIFICFIIYTFVGTFALDPEDPRKTPGPGAALIVFSALAIAAFATTWGPIVWAAVAEMYPTRYRAPAMALATASNWLWNFLISFFTRFITDKIHYWYGLVFAGSTLALVFIVFFFMIETKDRSLEEIDTMYLLHVNPIHSANWDGSKIPSDSLPSSVHGNDIAQEHAEAPKETAAV